MGLCFLMPVWNVTIQSMELGWMAFHSLHVADERTPVIMLGVTTTSAGGGS